MKANLKLKHFKAIKIVGYGAGLEFYLADYAFANTGSCNHLVNIHLKKIEH